MHRPINSFIKQTTLAGMINCERCLLRCRVYFRELFLKNVNLTHSHGS